MYYDSASAADVGQADVATDAMLSAPCPVRDAAYYVFAALAEYLPGSPWSRFLRQPFPDFRYNTHLTSRLRRLFLCASQPAPLSETQFYLFAGALVDALAAEKSSDCEAVVIHLLGAMRPPAVDVLYQGRRDRRSLAGALDALCSEYDLDSPVAPSAGLGHIAPPVPSMHPRVPAPQAPPRDAVQLNRAEALVLELESRCAQLDARSLEQAARSQRSLSTTAAQLRDLVDLENATGR